MKRLLLWVFAVGLPILFVGALALKYSLTEEYRRYSSPDQQYKIVIFRQPMLFGMPGQGSDAPGYIVLIGPKGRVLQRRSIKMVQLVSMPQWQPKHVSMKLLFDWPLP